MSNGQVWEICMCHTCFFISNDDHRFNCSALIVKKLLQLRKLVIDLSNKNSDTCVSAISLSRPRKIRWLFGFPASYSTS